MIKKLFSKLLNNKDFLKLVKDSSLVMFARISSVLLGFVINLIIAREFGSEILGITAILNSVIMISCLLISFGMNTSIIKVLPPFLRSRKTDLVLLIRNFYIIFLLVGGLFSIIIYYLTPFISINIFDNILLEKYLVTFSFFVIIIAVKDFNLSILRGLKKYKMFSFFLLIPNIIILFSLLLVTLDMISLDPLLLFIIIPAFISISTLFVALFSIISTDLSKNLNIKKRPYSFSKILKISMPMFLLSAMQLIMSQADIVMIGVFLPETSVGVYSIAIKLSLLTSFMLTSVNNIVSPQFSELYHDGKIKELKNKIRYSNKLIFFTSLPILIILLLFGRFILSKFGDEFVLANIALRILVLGQILNSSCGSIGHYLVMTGKGKVFNRILFLSLIFNIILNYIFIPLIGINGAALASFISLVVWNVSAVLYTYRKDKILFLYTGWLYVLKKYINVFFVKLDYFMINKSKKTNVLIVGDSHVMVFEYIKKNKKLPKHRLFICKSVGATALGVINPNSKTQSFNKFKAIIKKEKYNYIVIQLGEVDCGFLIWLRSEKYNVSLHDQLEESLANYYKFILWIKDNSDAKIILTGAILPSISDDANLMEMKNLRKEVSAKQYERTQLTLEYNDRLKSIAKELDCNYIDISDDILNNKTKVVDKYFLSDDITDHHLSNERTCDLWLNKLFKIFNNQEEYSSE